MGTTEEVAHLDARGDVSRTTRAPNNIRLLCSCHRYPDQGTQEAKVTVVHCLSLRTGARDWVLTNFRTFPHLPSKRQNTGPDQNTDKGERCFAVTTTAAGLI